MTEDEIGVAYYRVLNNWHDMTGDQKRAALVTVGALKAEAQAAGSCCLEELAALKHLEKQIDKSLNN